MLLQLQAGLSFQPNVEPNALLGNVRALRATIIISLVSELLLEFTHSREDDDIKLSLDSILCQKPVLPDSDNLAVDELDVLAMKTGQPPKIKGWAFASKGCGTRT